MADLYDVTDWAGEFVHMDVESYARARELAQALANERGIPAYVQRAVDPEVEGSEALYDASDDAEEVPPTREGEG